jgi:hypothetical protein
MQRRIIFAAIFFVVISGILAWIYTEKQAVKSVSSYSECIAAGYPVMESDPPLCTASDGTVFTGIMQHVTPTTVVNAEKNIIVTQPEAKNFIVLPYFAIAGRARVFENVLQYRLKKADGTVLAEGKMEAKSPDAGQYGDFFLSDLVKEDYFGAGTVEVFSYSAKDGSEINKVVIPVTFAVPTR